MVNFEQALDELKGRYKVKLVSTSYLGLGPGDIVMVSYPRKNKITKRRSEVLRVGFIMSSSKTDADSGIKISSKLNQLINFVDAEGISGAEFADIVNKLYNKELEPKVSKFRYVYGGDLQGTTIMDKFKTFNVSEISGNSVYRVELNENE
jgi:hypothetical protein